MVGSMFALLQRQRGDRRAVTSLEYGLIAACLAVSIIGSVQNLGTHLTTTFTTISTHL